MNFNLTMEIGGNLRTALEFLIAFMGLAALLRAIPKGPAK